MTQIGEDFIEKQNYVEQAIRAKHLLIKAINEMDEAISRKIDDIFELIEFVPADDYGEIFISIRNINNDWRLSAKVDTDTEEVLWIINGDLPIEVIQEYLI